MQSSVGDCRKQDRQLSGEPRHLNSCGRRVLRELDVRGVPTTRDVALDILGSDEFRSGDYSTSFLEEAGAKLPALAGA